MAKENKTKCVWQGYTLDWTPKNGERATEKMVGAIAKRLEHELKTCINQNDWLSPVPFVLEGELPPNYKNTSIINQVIRNPEEDEHQYKLKLRVIPIRETAPKKLTIRKENGRLFYSTGKTKKELFSYLGKPKKVIEWVAPSGKFCFDIYDFNSDKKSEEFEKIAQLDSFYLYDEARTKNPLSDNHARMLKQYLYTPKTNKIQIVESRIDMFPILIEEVSTINYRKEIIQKVYEKNGLTFALALEELLGFPISKEQVRGNK